MLWYKNPLYHYVVSSHMFISDQPHYRQLAQTLLKSWQLLRSQWQSKINRVILGKTRVVLWCPTRWHSNRWNWNLSSMKSGKVFDMLSSCSHNKIKCWNTASLISVPSFLTVSKDLLSVCCPHFLKNLVSIPAYLKLYIVFFALSEVLKAFVRDFKYHLSFALCALAIKIYENLIVFSFTSENVNPVINKSH